ncbi:MAG: hypothetical protein AAGA30_16845, partial [Planctomycetota bacterium]
PVEPFEWTATEKEWLLASPLQRRDVIQYRCNIIARAALVKSSIFACVMIPDIPILPLGFLGILMALLVIEWIRSALEIIAYGLQQRELSIVRLFIFGGLLVIGVRALLLAYFHFDFESSGSAASLGFLFETVHQLTVQESTWYGQILLWPFQQFAQIMLATSVSFVLVCKLLGVGLATLLLRSLLPVLDGFFSLRKNVSDKQDFGLAIRMQHQCISSSTQIKNAPSIANLGGIGAIAWRQWLGAVHFKSSLTVSLLIPAFLSCMPAFSGVSGVQLVTNTVGALAFYSLVLLPASLKFDFRRDLDRLVILKSLPISNTRLVIGQLAVPILITSLFQLGSLLLAMAISPYSPIMLLVGMFVLLPFNLFIFSFENLVVLWSPHRISQEGMQVLLRSILVFTAKSVIFGLAFGVTFAWVLLAGRINDMLFREVELVGTSQIFVSGIFALTICISLATFGLLIRAYRRFDTTADLCGLD